jgi:hypothetical protein
MPVSERVKDWKFVVPAVAVLLGGGSFGGTALYANDKPTRREIKTMIAEAPSIIVLQREVIVLQREVVMLQYEIKHLAERVDDNQEETSEKLDEILDAIKDSN